MSDRESPRGVFSSPPPFGSNHPVQTLIDAYQPAVIQETSRKRTLIPRFGDRPVEDERLRFHLLNSIRHCSRDLKGCLMRSLLVVALALLSACAGMSIPDAKTGGRIDRNDELEAVGKQLRNDIDDWYQSGRKHKTLRPGPGIPISSTVSKHIGVGLAFEDAERILVAAKFNVHARPIQNPLPSMIPAQDWEPYSLRANTEIDRGFFYGADAVIELLPAIPGSLKGNRVKEVKAFLYYKVCC